VPGLGGGARRPIAGVTLTRERQASGNRSNASYRHAKVVAERIANSEAEALGNPVKTINKAYAIKKGQLEIALDDLGPFEAYALTITLSR